MVHHIVCWNYNKELTDSEKIEAGQNLKEKLESLVEKIPGTLDIQVILNVYDSSNREVCLLSKFESKEALNGYQIHPEHMKVADYIKSVTCDRICFDYEN